MTTSGGIRERAANTPELDNLLVYYSSEGATKATAAPRNSRMRAEKYETSAQSTDSEHTGTRSRSSESSSLGDPATAAARVLATWQDRGGASPGTAAAVAAVAAAAGAGSASIAENNPSLWAAAQQQSDRVHSSTSTPRPSRSDLDPHMREGSAPVSGSLDAGQRRPDMGFLALLNSAAAYVAESSDSPDARSHQQQHITAAYTAHSELLSESPMSFPAISGGFDLEQALQRIAATTTGPDGGLTTREIVDSAGQQPFGVTAFGAGEDQMDESMATASAVRPDQIMAGNCAVPFEAAAGEAGASGSSSVSVAAGHPKRKRKDGSLSQQSPARRKTSHASDSRDRPTPPADLRRAARKWTDEETDNLLWGCGKYGVGAWKKILDDPSFTFNNRTSVDLKDRFRTIRAQECAHSPYAKANRKSNAKVPDVVWPLPPNSQRLQGLHRVQRKPTRNYTGDEDRRLLIGVLRHANHWTKIAADPELQLGNRPGQSLRDRLRNAFPEVFELFGYVIPKKERADRERFSTPGPSTPQKTPAPSKRKAPTGSKRMEGDIPENIREKILAILHKMNASLDPHPIPDGDGQQGAGSGMASPASMSQSPGAGPASSMGSDYSSHSSRRRSNAADARGGGHPDEKPAGIRGVASGSGAGRNRRASARRARAGSKAATGGLHGAQTPVPEIGTANAIGGFRPSDGSIHSAPAVRGDHASEFGQQQQQQQRGGSMLLESISPSVFSRPMSMATPTDQLDALALEGCVANGYSTPTQSTKRRHSVQSSINDALAAAAAAAGIDRSNLASALHFFNPTMTAGLEHSPGPSGPATHQHLGTADSIRRMTVGGPVGADPFLFPRLPDEDSVAAAAAVAAAAGMEHISSAQGSANTPVSEHSAHSARIASISDGTVGGHSADGSEFKCAAAPSMSSASAMSLGSAGEHPGDYHTGPRGQLRSAQRLLRANGVADDNSIGLSTSSVGDSRMDLEALSQFSQWFPGLASGNLGWGLTGSSHGSGTAGGDTSGSAGHLCNESIDPNMLEAGLGSAATMVGSAGGSSSDGLGNGDHGHESGHTHARRRSQFDWYGLTPSLAAALDAAGTTAAAVAAQVASVSDTAGLTPLTPFSVAGSVTPHQSSSSTCRRPSMPIFPSFAYGQGGEMMDMSGDAHHHPMVTADAGTYSTSSQDGANMAAAAAAAVAAALSEGSRDSLTIQTADPGSLGPPAAGMRSYSLGTGSAMASNALAKAASQTSGPQTLVARPRVTSSGQHGRRRTMHVPPSLVEGVASSGFDDSAGSSAAPQVAQPQRTQRGYMYPPRPSSTSASGAARVRRSRTVSNNQNQNGWRPAGHHQQQLSVVSESLSGLSQSPMLSDAGHHDDDEFAGPGARHRRTFSGTQLHQDVMGGLPGMSAGLMGTVGDHFDLAVSGGFGSQAGDDGAKATSSASSSMEVDLDAMTALGTSDAVAAAAAAAMDLSLKASLWAGEDSSQLSAHDETRSLIEPRGGDLGSMVELYRPASLTPTGGHHRYLGAVGTNSARNASPNMAAQQPAAVASPVAPRSAASTPGRREAVGF
ncbi:hypothetical protein GGF46_004610 [Coemansia sp. RSA 552]|nr:hypothetical protein GGF46_004610 [Coemansia sp. RSA 552]